jgi:DNA polymerase II large subunit
MNLKMLEKIKEQKYGELLNIEMNSYFKEFEKNVKLEYKIANNARRLNLDPKQEVEIPLAISLAEKVVGLVSTIYPQLNDKKISNRILKLEKNYGKLDTTISFKIAEEIAKQKFCKFSSLIEAIDAGIRVGFAYATLGVVSSPIEGYTGIRLGKTRDGKDYFIANFSGPIRSAGTTASVIVLMIIDYLREIFGYSKYDPSNEEIKRYITENNDYHDRVTNLQYLPTEEEAEFLAKNLPIQISGDPTEKREVSNYKNLARVETDFIRGGMCLIFSEGLAQKAAKGLRLLNGAKKNGIKSGGWDFLSDYVELQKKREKGKTDKSPTYIKDLVAGRPVFGHPSRSGGFRFRYGRSRVSGFSAASIHPATMAVTGNFIAIGTQLKIEKPTKGCIVTSCDSIDGPIVKLLDGCVKRLETVEEVSKIHKDIDEIIYFGDILFPFSDLANRNSDLINPGYVEEWWWLELQSRDADVAEKVKVYNLELKKAIELSNKYDIPLYPKYIYYWTEITKEEFFSLINWLNESRFDKKIILPYSKSNENKFGSAKRALELIGVEHDVTIENVVIDEVHSRALLLNLGFGDAGFSEIGEHGEIDFIKSETKIDINISDFNENDSVLEIVNSLSKFKIKNKAGEFIGARMGRPEKAKLRKLTGSPHVLFPIGDEGGRLRSVQAAVEVGTINSNFPLYFCNGCKNESIYSVCENCNEKTERRFYCRLCEKVFSSNLCLIPEEHGKAKPFMQRKIEIPKLFQHSLKMLNLRKEESPILIKGIRGTSSENHVNEHLSKGVLRATYGLQVNKDGTIRYDATEVPITHFRPKEAYVSVERLKDLGYRRDVHGKEIISDDQIIELKPHDFLLPSCPDSSDERGDDVFIKIACFIDSLLERFYGLNPYYNVKKREDLIGKLCVCMAPHNCAGVVSRIIGFSKTQGLMASPYMHAAMRRDCDGDEAAVMLLMDVLLNFSREFLPSHRGGTQDAPLVLNAKIDAGEVDDQILDLEIVGNKSFYPLELYTMSENKEHSSSLDIVNVKTALRDGQNPFFNIGYTHETENINGGVLCSAYKQLATMQEKVEKQMELVERLRSVDTNDVARLIIEQHFIRDIKGNLRKFSQQQFRCVSCNEKFRRPPLIGKCTKCNGKIIFTISEGGIVKYLEPALGLAEKYELSPYIKQTLELVKRYIESVFGKETEKQEALGRWF